MINGIWSNCSSVLVFLHTVRPSICGISISDEKGENFIDDVQILITDIEMPQMDGHTLTRKIKEHKILKSLPVIIFSSLITGDLMHKGQSVGADGQMSKPEIGKLLNLIDGLTIEK